MRRRYLGWALACLLAPWPLQAQYLSLHVGAGAASGARPAFTDGGSVFPAGLLGVSLGRGAITAGIDARVLGTSGEPLGLVSLVARVALPRRTAAQPYLMVTAGTGSFLEEGDPGHHFGVGFGVRGGGRTAVFGEARYDQLVGTFTHNPSRSRALGSLVVGLRLDWRRSPPL
jgi:hypothetical protein